MKFTVRNVGHKEKMRHDIGTWLNPYPWQWYVTLTFAMDRISPDRAKELFEEFVQASGANAIYFMVIEWHRFRDNVHIHALLGNVENEPDWGYGISRVLRYNSKLGARFYLSKFICSEGVEWDFKLN
jgi:hypothetical protein